MKRAITSLPVPVSPVINTVASDGAMRRADFITSFIIEVVLQIMTFFAVAAFILAPLLRLKFGFPSPG